MSHFPITGSGTNMQNQPDFNLDENYTSAEQLLASLGEVSISDPLPHHLPMSTPENYGDTFRYAPQDPAPTDWNYGLTGLLDPLKRPDPNQIPPDVLAYLLKSGKFNEVLNNGNNSGDKASKLGASTGDNQHQLNNFLPMEGSNWRAQGPPQAQFQQQQHNWSSSIPAASGSPNDLCRFPPSTQQRQKQGPYQSTLSPLAAEFVPRQFSPRQQRQEGPSNDDELLLMQAIAELTSQNSYPLQNQNRTSPPRYQQQHHQFHSSSYSSPPPRPHFQQQQRGDGFRQQHQRSPHQPRNNSGSTRQRHYRPPMDYSPPAQQHSPFETSADRVLTAVTDTIAHLTGNPADFNALVKKTVRVLKESLKESDTLEIVVTLIVEQSVGNRNFSSTGARLCQALNEHKVQVGALTAQHCVINHVQEVFASAIKSILTTSDELRERHIGLLFLLAELYVRFEMDNTGKSFFGFGMAMCEMMSKLISPESGGAPHENIKIVLNVLKMSGWELEQNPHPTLKADVEKLMKELSALLEQPGIQLQTKSLIEKVFELRKINWGREDEEPSTPSEPEPSLDPPATVVYDGKSQETVYEQPSSSDDDACYLDDESEEVNNCYDQFLNTLPAEKEADKEK